MKKYFSCLAALLFFSAHPVFAEDNALPLNFDTQIIQVFQAAQTTQRSSSDHPLTDGERAVLARILDKFRHHHMVLKNVVYRTDTGNIRITWADDHNEDVVKVAYKTGKDKILGNSVYADKRQIIDAKIMYRKTPDTYDYLHLVNLDHIQPSGSSMNAPQSSQSQNTVIVENNLSNEKCGFCHVLARNDGSPSGVFFPRYQESYTDRETPEVSSLFHTDGFEQKSARDAAELGLPDMKEDFIYRKVDVDVARNDNPPENVRFLRALIELPQLIEVMARDNAKSTCVAVDTGRTGVFNGMGDNDYVCADNAAQRLYVKLTNRMIVNGKQTEYSQPYFEKK